jgi:uncharacterized protein (DUF2141 family)
MTRRVTVPLLSAVALILVVCVPALAQAQAGRAYTVSRPALSAAPHAAAAFTVSGILKPKSSIASRAVVKIRVFDWANGQYKASDTYRATLSKNPGAAGTKYACSLTISTAGWHAVGAVQYRHGKLVSTSKLTYFDVVAGAVGQNLAVDSDSHATVTALSGQPIDVVFHSASGKLCGRTVHFLSSALTRTCADPLTFHADALPAGSYAWQCNMGPGCCGGTLVVRDPQQIAVNSDSHATVTAESGRPIDVIFASPSNKMCGKTVHFLDTALTKTSSAPLTWHSDSLPPGNYVWQCDMGPQCCGGILVIKDAQQIAVDSDSHADVTALAGKPIDVIFRSPSNKMCGKTVHFMDPSFTKTSSDPLTYHSDGLAAGSYAWQCTMGPQCCGGNLILQ